MKTLNQIINEYTSFLQQGEIQTAYKEIINFFGKLRARFISQYPNCDIGGIYQGYMDMTYFSFSSKPQKEKGLKIAIVYLYEKGTFEAWLSARNRDIAKKYETVLTSGISQDVVLFHDINNKDAIIENVLTSSPDFDDQSKLIEILVQRVETFATAISDLI